MSNIINFSDYKKKKDEEVILHPEPVDICDLAQMCIDDISELWSEAAKYNKLNEFFIASSAGFSSPDVFYILDLNRISSLENKLNLSIISKSPSENLIGWSASFLFTFENVDNVYDEILIQCPSVHYCESYARCFNILLYLKMRREIKMRKFVL